MLTVGTCFDLVAWGGGQGSLDVIVEVESFGLFPGESLAAEVTEAGGLGVDRLVQLEVFDDAAGSEVEVIFDDRLDQGI